MKQCKDCTSYRKGIYCQACYLKEKKKHEDFKNEIKKIVNSTGMSALHDRLNNYILKGE